jgi:cytochrome P450
MPLSVISPAQLIDPELHATGDPHQVWRWMRTNAPVYRHAPGVLPAFWSVTRHDDIRSIYRNPQVFSSAHGVLLRPASLGEDPGGGQTLALTDPPRHRALRALVSTPFSERSARRLEESMRAAARDAIGRALEQEVCDVAHDVAAWLSIHLVSLLLGVPRTDREMLFQWTGEAFAVSKPLTAHSALMRYFIDLMYQRMEDAGPDVLSRLVEGTVDDRLLTEKEILLNIENIVGATENAGLSMASGVQTFLEHPDEWRRLQQDRSLIASAVAETLRWTSSATHSMRTATAPVMVGGHQLEPGDRVVVWIPSGNRDERVFDQADRFDVGRRSNRHLALGSGEHVCIGGAMALVQMRLLFEALLDMVGTMEQCGPTVPLRSIAVSGPAHLPVRLRPR